MPHYSHSTARSVNNQGEADASDVRASVITVADTTATEEDTTAGNMGAAFTEIEDEEEWMRWVDWEAGA